MVIRKEEAMKKEYRGMRILRVRRIFGLKIHAMTYVNR